MKRSRKRTTLQRQVARLKAANDKAEAQLAEEKATMPTLAEVWRKAIGAVCGSATQPLSRPPRASTTNPKPSMKSSDIRDLQRRTQAYINARADLDVLERDLVTKSDFTLDAASCAQFAEVAGSVVYARAVEKPLRAAVSAALNSGANAASTARGRIQSAHQQIDREIVALVRGSLPPELAGVEVISGELRPTTGGAFLHHEGAAIPKVHIGQSRWGKAEAAVRVDPMGASAAATVQPDASFDILLARLGTMADSLEKLEKEEIRCSAVLQKFAQKAA